MKLDHGLSALLQLHLHSRLNIWLQWLRQRQLQDETRNIQLFGFGATYIRGMMVICFCVTHCGLGMPYYDLAQHLFRYRLFVWQHQTIYICSSWTKYHSDILCKVQLIICRDQSRCASSQWEASIHCNHVSHWLGAYLGRSLNNYVSINFDNDLTLT